MKKKAMLTLLGMMTFLCVSTAYAAYFSASLPTDEYIYDACRLNSNHLAVLTNANVYQVDLETGESKYLAPRLENATFLFCSGDGDIHTMISDDSSEYEQRLYRIDASSSTWVEEAVIPLDQATYGAMDAAFVGDLLFFTLSREGQPSLLASYGGQTGQVTAYGAFSLNEGCGEQLIVADGVVMAYDMDYDRMQAYLFQYDPQSGELQQTAANLPVSGDIYTLDYSSDQRKYWAVLFDGAAREQALYSGEQLDTMSKVISPIHGTRIVAAGDDCIIVEADKLMSYQVIENAHGNLTLANFHTAYDSGFTIQTGITVSSTEDSLSDILNMRNSNIDLIGFTPESIPSLKTIKKKHYFVDLSASSILTQQVERLYPSLSKALWTDAGELTAWIIDAQPYMFGADESLLSEYGLPVPATIPELLNQMKVLTDENVFESGEYVPFDAMDYDQKSLIEYSLRRYIFEQELQGERLSFDSELLRSLLERILNEVPKEAPYKMETGDEKRVYSLNTVYIPISKHAHLPLRVGDDSPSAIQTQTYMVLVNPYSMHQAEAIAYLEYIAQQRSDTDYVLYQDQSAPKISSYVEAQLEEINRQIEVLSAQEDSAGHRDQLQALQESRALYEANLYEISNEDIAVWQAAAGAMVVQEETLYTSELNELVERLVNQNISIDAFVAACNRYISMVYMENNE